MVMQFGFSLIELMVAVTILALLATAALPSFSEIQQKGSLSVASNELFSSLRLARSEAVKRARRVTVCKTDSAFSDSPLCDGGANWQDGWLVFVDDNEDGSRDAGEELIQAHDYVQFGIAVTTSPIFSNNVSYSPAGSTTTTVNNFASGTIVVDYAGYSKTLSLSTTGRVRVN